MEEKHEDHLPSHEEEKEEALSLCDLPLNTDETDFEQFSITNNHSSKPTEFFEFFSDLSNSEMCSAEDIIFCGKLVPLKDQQHFLSKSKSNSSNINHQTNKHAAFRRRSESLSELQSTTRSNSTKTKLVRNSRSLDYRKLHRSSSSEPEFDRNMSAKSDKSNCPKVPKSRWYMLMFGMGVVKFPAEMELRDIKNRQVRRNPAAMFPAVGAGRNNQVNRSTGKGSSWGLLKALSCKDHANVTVAASFGCISQM